MLITDGKLVYNRTGDTLGYYPHPRQTADGAAVIEDLLVGIDSAGREIQASTTATLDTTSTTTDAAAGPSQADPAKVPVTATTGFVVGRRYWIQDVDGHGESFEVSAISAGDYVIATRPLLGEYASGAAVDGLLLSFALADVVVTDEDRMRHAEPMRVVWTLADGSKFQQLLRLVRHDQADIRLDEVRSELLEIFPDIGTRLTQHGKDLLHGHVRAAHRQVRTLMAERGIDPEQLLLGDLGLQVVVWQVLLHLSHLGNIPGNVDFADWNTYCKEQRDMFLDNVLVGTTGKETMDISRPDDIAGDTEGHVYRRTIEIGLMATSTTVAAIKDAVEAKLRGVTPRFTRSQGEVWRRYKDQRGPSIAARWYRLDWTPLGEGRWKSHNMMESLGLLDIITDYGGFHPDLLGEVLEDDWQQLRDRLNEMKEVGDPQFTDGVLRIIYQDTVQVADNSGYQDQYAHSFRIDYLKARDS